MTNTLISQEEYSLDSLYQAAVYLTEQGEYTASNRLYQELITAKSSQGYCAHMHESLAIADNLFKNEEDDEGLLTIEKWLDLFDESSCDDYGAQVDAYVLKYRLCAALNQRKESKIALDSANMIGYQHLDHVSAEMGYVHQYYARHYGAIGANYLAVKHAEESFDIRQKLYAEDHPLYAQGLYSLANYAERVGDYERSYECLNTIIKYQAGGNEKLLANAYHLLALICIRMGDYATAVKYSLLALERYDDLYGKGSLSSSYAYNELGSAYKGLEQYQRSKDALTAAHKIRNRINGPYHRLTLSSITQLTHIKFALGDTLGAISDFKKIVDDYLVAYDIDKSDKYVLSMLELGDLFHRAGEVDSALHYYHKANSIAVEYYKTGDRPHVQANHRLSFSVPLADRRAYSKSALFHLTTDSSFHAIDEHTIPFVQDRFHILKVYATHAQNLFELYQTSGDLIHLKELVALQPQFEIIKNETFRQFLSPKSIVQSAPRIRDIALLLLGANEILYQATSEAQYINGALLAMEESKNLVLQVQLFEKNLKHILNIPDSIHDKQRQLFNRINQLKRDQLELQSDSLNRVIIDLEKEYLDLRRENLLASKKYSRIVKEADFNLSQLQSEMAADEMIINYFLDKGELYILCVTDRSSTLERRAFSQEDADLLKTYLNYIKRIPAPNQPDQWSIGHELFLKLLPDQIPEHIVTLKIIPDNNLYVLPFDALIQRKPGAITEYAQLPFLIQDYDISYLSGLRMGRQKNSINVSDEVLGFAPFTADLDSSPVFLPLLQYSDQELNEISEVYNLRKYTGTGATEDVFKSQSGNHSIIHIASHALVDDAIPLNSNILFYPSDTMNEDGQLALWELYAMDIPAKLAVLSACQTSDGAPIRGAGINNIARGFYTAGTNDVVSNLWPAQDYAASEVMKSFYKNLRRSKDPSFSLRQAKLTYLNAESGLLAHPMYWAGWVLQSSEIGTPPKKGFSFTTRHIVFLLLLPLLLLFLLRSK